MLTASHTRRSSAAASRAEAKRASGSRAQARANHASKPAGTAPNCSETGVLGAAAGVMGTLQALEVMKEILGIGETLAGKLLIYDALSARFRTVTVSPDPKCALCGANPAIRDPG